MGADGKIDHDLFSKDCFGGAEDGFKVTKAKSLSGDNRIEQWGSYSTGKPDKALTKSPQRKKVSVDRRKRFASLTAAALVSPKLSSDDGGAGVVRRKVSLVPATSKSPNGARRILSLPIGRGAGNDVDDDGSNLDSTSNDGSKKSRSSRSGEKPSSHRSGGRERSSRRSKANTTNDDDGSELMMFLEDMNRQNKNESSRSSRRQKLRKQSYSSESASSGVVSSSTSEQYNSCTEDDSRGSIRSATGLSRESMIERRRRARHRSRLAGGSKSLRRSDDDKEGRRSRSSKKASSTGDDALKSPPLSPSARKAFTSMTSPNSVMDAGNEDGVAPGTPTKTAKKYQQRRSVRKKDGDDASSSSSSSATKSKKTYSSAALSQALLDVQEMAQKGMIRIGDDGKLKLVLDLDDDDNNDDDNDYDNGYGSCDLKD